MDMVNWMLPLKLIHVSSAMLFVGNIFVTGWWKINSEWHTPAVQLFANKLTRSTDKIFISFFGWLTVLTGAGMVYIHPLYTFNSTFVVWALLLWGLSIITWVISVPYLKKQRLDLATNKGAKYKYYDRRWFWWGIVATVADVAILPLMIWRPL